MAAPLPDDTRQAIADAITAGGTCRGVARQFDVSPSTVRKVAAAYGITGAFSREQTEAATQAKVADLAARRAVLAAGLLDDADHIRRRARAEYRTQIATRDEVHEIVLPEPPLGEVRHAFSAIGIAIDKHIALIKHDTTESGTSAIDQWLTHMLGAAAATLPDDDG